MTVDRTEIFDKWLLKLKDYSASAHISRHIKRMESGNLGNIEPVGSGVYEKKINYGAGYRLYFFQKGTQIIVLLCGGDKSTQQSDINKAIKLKGAFT